MSNFKAADYKEYNRKFGFDKYKQLYDLMQELFNLLPFEEKNYEDDSFFVFYTLIALNSLRFFSTKSK